MDKMSITKERIKEILIEHGINDYCFKYIDLDNTVLLYPQLGRPMYEFYSKVYEALYEMRREGFAGMVVYTFNDLKHVIST
jgi:hypothetical protein